MENWHIWVIVAMGLFIAEIFTPGFVLACLGIGCLASGLVSFYHASAQIQILTFSVTTLAVFVVVRPFFYKYLYSTAPKIRTNVDALVGKAGFVSERIEPKVNRGRVLVEGEDWKGVAIDETIIEVDTRVTIVKVEGTRVFVKIA